jgi:carboxyl-terminal processing protease
MKRWYRVLGVIVVVACGRTQPIPTAITTISTLAAPAGPTFEITQCSDEDSGEFAVLCEAYDLIHRHYVDPIDDAEMAAAAALGVDSLDAGSEPGTLTCALPAQAFTVVCETMAEQGAGAAVGIEAALRGIVEFALDPNSAYLDAEALEQIREDQAGEVQGIGALVTSEDLTADDPRATPCGVVSDTCRMVIVSLLEGSPALAAGLAPDDVMVGVNGEDITGWTIDEVTAEVRGPAGTEVQLDVLRGDQRMSFILIRAALVVPVIEPELVEGHIGYIRLNLFTENADVEFRAALQKLVLAGADWLILDLRDNPGGSLDTTVNIVSEFLAEGVVVRTVAPNEEITYRVEEGGVATEAELPLVILVNRGSASASEVVSATLQESGRAIVIGERTFGKNTVQQRFGLSNGAALKLTVARWVTPGGTDFGGSGVLPDVETDLPTDLSLDDLVAEVADLAGL